MADVFIGGGRHKVDQKGRVSIPAEFRRVLEAADPACNQGQNPNFIINFGDPRRKYLECLTMAAFEEINAQIQAKPRGSKKRKALEAFYYAGSQRATVDETGRIVLGAPLRKKIGLTDEARFVAAGDTFQIWHPDAYEKEAVPSNNAFLDEFPEDFDIAELLAEDDDT